MKGNAQDVTAVWKFAWLISLYPIRKKESRQLYYILVSAGIADAV